MTVIGEILKVLGQATPTATSLTTLYTVPSSFSAVISSISVCNQNSGTTALFRVSIAPGGAANSSSQYIYYDLPLAPNDTFIATIGISLAMGDVIRIQSDTANVSFNLLGIEVGAFSPPPANLAGGDLAGFYPNPTVEAIQGNDIKPEFLSSLQDGYVLGWNNSDGYWESMPVKEIQGNDIKPEYLGSTQDGYVLTWDNTNGYWKAKAMGSGSGGATIFDGGTPSNIRSDRSVNQSPIDNTKVGIINLSSDTSGVTAGAQSDFSTILGGDQNVIMANASHSTVVNGLENEIRSDLANTGSAASIIVNSNVNLTSSGLSITVDGNTVSVWGFSSVVGAIGQTLTISGAASANNNGNFTILGGNTNGAGNGYDIYNPSAPQGTDANNGSISTTGFETLVSGLTGMTDIGGIVNIHGAATTANNGSFLVVRFIDVNDVTIANPNAVTDANNGSLIWVEGSEFSSVVNGVKNLVTSSMSTVVSGALNRVNGKCNTVSGQMNLIKPGGNFCSIGGYQNIIVGDGNVICGGIFNTIPGTSGGAATNCFIGGGSFNAIISNGSAPNNSNISGGTGNSIYNGVNCTIGGGTGNFSNASTITIAGGEAHTVNGAHGTIGGGNANQVHNSHGTVGGGQSNTVSGDYGTVVGGQNNTISGIGSTCGGVNNGITGDYGTAFGTNNTVSGTYGTAVGTQCNVTGTAALACGIGGTAALGTASVALGFSSIAQRTGELSLSSTGDGYSQLGMLAIGGNGTNTSFVLQDASSQEFHLLNSIVGPAGNNYYSIQIRVVASATNAAVGPATWTWEVLAYTVAGVATIVGGSATNVITQTNGTGWLNTVTVDGTTDKLHITINTNTDTTNSVYATAFLQWAQIKAFSQ